MLQIFFSPAYRVDIPLAAIKRTDSQTTADEIDAAISVPPEEKILRLL